MGAELARNRTGKKTKTGMSEKAAEKVRQEVTPRVVSLRISMPAGAA